MWKGLNQKFHTLLTHTDSRNQSFERSFRFLIIVLQLLLKATVDSRNTTCMFLTKVEYSDLRWCFNKSPRQYVNITFWANLWHWMHSRAPYRLVLSQRFSCSPPPLEPNSEFYLSLKLTFAQHICIFLYLCIFVFLYLCIFVFSCHLTAL